MFSFFSSQTPIGERIDKATSDLLVAEDWAANLEVCDMVNSEENGARDAIKAVSKRLQNKNGQVQMYTLTLLESLVKNCDERFHLQLASREFMSEYVRLVTSKNAVCAPAREKMLSLLQAWVDAFRNDPRLGGIVEAYQSLRAQGVEFPAQDLDSLAPIHTPKATVAPTERRSSRSQADAPPPLVHSPAGNNNAAAAAPPHAAAPVSVGGRIQPSTAQLDKLRGDLSTVHANIGVLNQMLAQRDADPLVLSELHATCKAMQERVCRLLGQVADETLIVELLTANDGLNAAFAKYDARANGHVAPQQQQQSQGPRTGLLVDLDAPSAPAPSVSDRYAASTYSDAETGPLHSSIAGAITKKTAVGEPESEDPFGAFAESRAGASSFPVVSPIPAEPQPSQENSHQVSGSDFDAFLTQRSGEGVDQVRDNRKIQMEDANDDLFGL